MRRRDFLATVATGAALGTAGCLGGGPLAPSGDEPISVDGDWSQPDADAGRSRAAAGSGPGASYESRWRYGGDGDEYLAPGAVVDGRVFALSDERLVAVDASDGTEAWTADVDVESTRDLAVGPDRIYLAEGWVPRDPDADAPSVTSYPGTDGSLGRPPLVDDALYYVADDRLVAAEPGADDPLWTASFEAEAERVARAGDVVCAAAGRWVYGLDPTDGTEQWRYEALADEIAVVRFAGRADRLYVVAIGAPTPDVEDTVRAVDPATGEELWRYAHEFPAAVAATDDRVVLGPRPEWAEQHRALVLDADDGERLWATPEESNDDTYDAPIVADGTVYCSTVASVYAYDLATGEERWAMRGGRPIVGPDLYPINDPIVAGEGLFLGHDGDLYGLGPG